MSSPGPVKPSIREAKARLVGDGTTRALSRPTGSATVTLVAAAAFIAVTIALGLSLETTPSRTEEGWRLRGALAGAAMQVESAWIGIARLPAELKVV